MRFDTRLVHSGQRPEPGTGDVVPPVHLAVTYERSTQDPLRYFYSRGENPTREALEECLAALEDAEFATVYSSGQAASATVLSLLEPGQTVVCSDDVYGGTYALFAMLQRRGVRVRYADLADQEVAERAIGPDTDLVWIETPTNPLLKIADLARVSGHAHRHGALVVVDNTLASPVIQQPLRWGADITLYSTTKSIAGHLDVLGGALVYRSPDLHETFLAHRTTVGNVPGGLDCFLVHRGVKTLSLRVHRQVATAARIAEALGGERLVGRIHFPGGHRLVGTQMSAAGSLISFEYLADPVKLLERVRLFTCAVSLGGVRSLIECPAMMTHRPVPAEVRARLGITDTLIRLSAGIEDPADLVDDLITAIRAGGTAP